MRYVAAIFVLIHGLGHVIWFLSTWTQPALGREGRTELEARRSYFLVEPLGVAGKVLGILSLLVLVGFGTAAWGIAIQSSWWPEVLIGSAIISLPIVIAMWNPVGTVSARAFLADLVLGAAALMPWGEKILGAH